MADVTALNREFAKYDQVEKSHTYRLAEHESDEFDEDYAIATLDLGLFLLGDDGQRYRFQQVFPIAITKEFHLIDMLSLQPLGDL